MLLEWQTYLSVSLSPKRHYTARTLCRSALYTDALKPASLQSLTVQDDNINIVQGIKHILKSHSSLMKLTSQDPVEWPVTKVVLSRLKDENGGKVYPKDQSYIILGIPPPKAVQIKLWLT